MRACVCFGFAPARTSTLVRAPIARWSKIFHFRIRKSKSCPAIVFRMAAAVQEGKDETERTGRAVAGPRWAGPIGWPGLRLGCEPSFRS